MSGRWIAWWRLRTLREQRLLLVMFLLLFVVVAWVGIIRPLSDALATAKERHDRAVIALAEARSHARAIQLLERQAPPALSAPLNVVVSQSADAAGLTVSRIEPDGDRRATIVVDPVRPQAFFGWVAELEQRRGLVIDQLSVRTNSDQTLAAQLTVRARGG